MTRPHRICANCEAGGDISLRIRRGQISGESLRDARSRAAEHHARCVGCACGHKVADYGDFAEMVGESTWRG